MNEQGKTGLLTRMRSLVYLIPAALTAGMVLLALPRTAPVFAAIPERLERIVAQTAKAAEEIVFPADDPEESKPETLLAGPYEDGAYIGSSQGYGGLVTVQVTVENGNIFAVELLSAPGETEPYFTLAKTIIDIVLQRQTWEVDAVSGATYSSRGILGAVQNALTGEEVINEAPAVIVPSGTTVQDSYTEHAAYADGVYTGSAQGFGGTIQIEVTISGGKIQSITVVSAPYETADYLNRAKGVISAILSSGSPNVDAVSGATYSSTGIINAVKRALGKAAPDPVEPQDEELDTDDPGTNDPDTDDPCADEPIGEDAQASTLQDGSYIASAWCQDEASVFNYQIFVTLAVSDGVISSVTVEKGADESEEADPEDNELYLGYAISGRTRRGIEYPGIPQQIVEKQSTEKIDAVSGATWSSRTICDAAQAALEQAVYEPMDEPSDQPVDEPSDEPSDEPNDEPSGEPTDDESTGGPEGALNDPPETESGGVTSEEPDADSVIMSESRAPEDTENDIDDSANIQLSLNNESTDLPPEEEWEETQ